MISTMKNKKLTMRKFISATFLLLAAASISAQKTFNDPNVEVRNIKDFHAIRVSTGIELQLTQGDAEAVAVSAERLEDRDKIKTIVENGVLKIYFDYPHEKWWKFNFDTWHKKLKAYVSIKTIDGIHTSSGAIVKVDGSLKTDKLNLDASSGASFAGSVAVSGVLDVDQNSGSHINITGSAGKLVVDGSSGSHFYGYGLTARDCDAGTSSGAGVQVTVNNELSARASSGGQIHYKGNGFIRNVHTSSGGNVSKSN